jgi:FkbM family methyltransferase
MRGRNLARSLYNEVVLRCSPALANAIYERLPHKWLCYLLGHGVIGRTNAVFNWAITLANGEPLKIAVNPDDRFSVGCAFEYKAHDAGLKRTQEFFLDRCGERTVYLDIGANVGVSSIYALSAGKACWLFEPNKELHAFGKSLFAQNAFTHARWEAVALSDHAGEERFFVSRSSFLSSFDRDHAEREGAAVEIVVPMKTLDSYLPELQAMSDEVLVKIDVEGHEMPVLNGAKELLAAYRPVVMIELLGEPAARREAWAWFHAINYAGYGIFDEPVLRLQGLALAETLVSFGGINFVFVPVEHRLRGELEQHMIQS